MSEPASDRPNDSESTLSAESVGSPVDQDPSEFIVDGGAGDCAVDDSNSDEWSVLGGGGGGGVSKH